MILKKYGVSGEDPLRSFLLLESVSLFQKYACFYDTEMPLRLKLGSEILIVILQINSIMNSNEHPIIKVILPVIQLVSQVIALCGYEINSLITCYSEMPCPQQFFLRACWA